MSNYYPDDEPTQHLPSYGNYGEQPEPPVPWYRKPAGLVGLGAGGALIAVLVIYAIVQLFSSGGDNKPARLTPISATSASARTTTTTTSVEQTTAVAPPATETVTDTQAPDTPTTTDTGTTTATTTTDTPVTTTTTTTTSPSVSVSTSTTVITNTVTIPVLPQRPGGQ